MSRSGRVEVCADRVSGSINRMAERCTARVDVGGARPEADPTRVEGEAARPEADPARVEGEAARPGGVPARMSGGVLT